MRFQLNGSVEVTYKIRGDSTLLGLYFDAEEFSGIDISNGFVEEDGELVYRGVWDAVEENIQLKLHVVAVRGGLREKRWEILPSRGDLVEPAIGADRITAEFVEDEDAR
ncbi:hypothetical protein GT347_22590 [Xylophilus rhododendri]|uniref:Uncharacterized protein n=1 Tax=Xylophilus rhododendri TaxID=2697032 RepID=A0A857J9E4_9BURK|nr:hypothetical protein [Xylophilus rhododendri]QHJ00517.1 hypothetical protein GT347_22590 [Xylophilus rhododendri]